MSLLKWALAFTLLLPGTLTAVAQNQSGSTLLSDGNRAEAYRLGGALGQCLGKGCLIFEGTITWVGAPVEQRKRYRVKDNGPAVYLPIEMSVGKWLAGDAALRRPSFSLSYPVALLDPRAHNPSPWIEEQRTDPTVGSELIVAIYTSEDLSAFIKVHDISAAVFDQKTLRLVEDICRRHAEYLKTPDSLVDGPEALKATDNPMFGGYLVWYVAHTYAGHKPNESALIFSRLLSGTTLPERAWFDILHVGLWMRFNRISDVSTRQTATRAIVDAATGSDPRLAAAAIDMLRMLVDSKLTEVKTLISEDTKAKLVERFRTYLLAEYYGSGSHELKDQLGIPTKPR